jgi:Zn-dependent peptidase ImmA (M78 family)
MKVPSVFKSVNAAEDWFNSNCKHLYGKKSYCRTNLHQLCEEMGIDLWYTIEDENSKHADYLNMKNLCQEAEQNNKLGVVRYNSPFIWVKYDIWEERKRFTLAHEIAHFLLHRSADNEFNFRSDSVQSIGSTDKQEIDANELAAKILMPEPTLKILRKIPMLDWNEAKYIMGVSGQALEIRLERLGWLQ